MVSKDFFFYTILNIHCHIENDMYLAVISTDHRDRLVLHNFFFLFDLSMYILSRDGSSQFTIFSHVLIIEDNLFLYRQVVLSNQTVIDDVNTLAIM